MKTLIAVPCFDHVPARFCQSLAMMQVVGECQLAMKPGSLVYTARNDLAMLAIKDEFDYVLWLDSDMVFEPDLMVRMFDTLKSNDLDILTGLYFRRVNPYTPVLFDKLEIKGFDCDWSEFKSVPKSLFEVGGCGFGCVLMKTDVFFDVQTKHGNMFAPMGNNGEDVAFCWRARDCGFKIYCDPNIVLGHIGQIVIDDKFYNAFGGEDGNSHK